MYKPMNEKLKRKVKHAIKNADRILVSRARDAIYLNGTRRFPASGATLSINKGARANGPLSITVGGQWFPFEKNDPLFEFFLQGCAMRLLELS
jgi:hypothetical protein